MTPCLSHLSRLHRLRDLARPMRTQIARQMVRHMDDKNEEDEDEDEDNDSSTIMQ